MINISGLALVIAIAVLFISSLVAGIIFTRKKMKVGAIISFSVFGIILSFTLYVVYLLAQVI
ncbi:MAG: hypothetical protein ACJ76F_08385 [Bacteroidia bacterium]